MNYTAMKKNSAKLTYSAAKEELEAIVQKLKNGAADIDKLAAYIQRAGELLEFCKERLQQVEKQVTSDELRMES